ncbi:tripartite tricarboxylate transporter TctB family protein [Pararhizobium mangrovi]|uniref:Tripartite tricarboxylate transporter TctB family protein n=1 Tax=Pararhizobium mangrovi TaxID=2590452 RepID=A0A506TZU2_9HYPH|nr:tripartite tricarboxylate transporter TctB family protein [Pararhizobium mangrovi]TPW26264.1 tripartite tricarboxylate transporter TctB family protein [Pararhizobium mangrovi]
MSDRIFGGLGVLLAAFYIWQATLIKESFIQDPIGPKTFPIIIGLVLGAASLVMIFQPDDEPFWPSAGRLVEVLMAAVVMLAYSALVSSVGFIVTTTVVAAYLAWRLGAHPLKAVMAGLLIAVGIYIIFHLVLGLSIARGPFGF